MENNTQARKWALVINNPLEAGLDHAAIREILRRFAPSYFCMADEVATTGTYHTHIFLLAPSPIRFSTIKNRFPTAHIEKAYGSAKANRAYILKEGRWADTAKAETSVPGTFEEWGDLPAEKEEEAPEMFKLIQDLRAGKPVMEIIEDNPNPPSSHFGGKVQCRESGAGSDLPLRRKRNGKNTGHFREA